MPRFPAILPAGLVLLFLLFLCAPAARGQLDLPKTKKKKADPGAEETPPKQDPPAVTPKTPGRGLVPHLVCATCGTHNYVSNFQRPTEDGLYMAHCSPCGRDMKHSRAKDVARDEKLDLPDGQTPPSLPPGPQSQGASPVVSPVPQQYGDGAAAFILAQVAETRDLHASVVHQAVGSLSGLGEEGLTAARSALYDPAPSVVLVAGRVLLRGGLGEDAERLVRRLRTPMPGKSGTLLLTDLYQQDPVHGSPELLAELLDHPQQPMRALTARLFGERIDSKTLPLLRAPLASKRATTRLLALELVADVDDPAVIEILLVHLSDRSARAASFAASALAGLEDDRVPLELVGRAFNSRWILRENAYALLGLIDIEERRLTAILDERHVESLLRGMESNDLFVSGSCAAALAGIGFRSAQPTRTLWLDRDVTGRLVALISGKEYHNDFSSVQPRALTRLRRLSGQEFGTDGPAWTTWWIENRDGFYAHRAYLGVPPEGEGMLEIHYRATGRDAAAFSLMGARADLSEASVRIGAAESFLLTDHECRDLLSLMEREGVLGPERVPGVRGREGSGQRTIEILVGGRGKAFIFGPGETEAWFDRLGAALRDLRDRNRWQRFADLARFETPREFWEVEAGWWATERTELERAVRLKGLILSWVGKRPPSQRSYAYRELEGVFGVEGAVSSEDFETLLALLRDEGFFAERVQLLVALALQAAGGGPEAEGLVVDAEKGTRLIQLLLARFQQDAMSAMGQVASACGRPYVRELAADPHPLLRAVAAAELSRATDEIDAETLMALLEDSEPVVETAAVLSLGEGGVQDARTELLLRARMASPMVRAAALQSVGKLGGEYVLEALVLGVADSDLEIRRGAAQGLAELADPQSAPLLISLLRRDREDEVYEAALAGLKKLGMVARPDLLRVVQSPAHHARLDAAILLSQLGVAEVVPSMLDLLESEPTDATLGFELATLSCVDLRGADDPAGAWREWYDEVTHTDAQLWLFAAMERRGRSAPLSREFVPPGTRDAALFLLEAMSAEEDYLAARGRRELARMLGRDLGEAPSLSQERAAWLSTLRDSVLRQFD